MTLTIKNTNCFQVDPNDFPEASLWLQSSDASTITLNGSLVSQWDDKTPNSNDAVQATDTNQPSYAGGIVTFDGNDNYMTVADDATLRMNAGDFTMVFVGKTNSNATQRIMMKGQSGGVGNAYKRYDMRVNNGFAVVEIDDNTTLKTVTDTTTYIRNKLVSIIAMRDGNNLRILVNGVENASPTDITGYGDIDESPLTDLHIGRTVQSASAFFSDEMRELMIFKQALNTSQLASMNAYIASNYTLQS